MSLRQKEAAAAFRALLDELRAEADVRVDGDADSDEHPGGRRGDDGEGGRSSNPALKA